MLIKHIGSGSVTITSSTEYHIYEKYKSNLKIRYDLGLMPLYLYRVSGRGRLPYLFKPTKGIESEIVYSQIYNIFSRSIEEVPLQLKRQEFSGYVYKVYKYEKAILNKDFINDVNDGIVDPNNYGFIDVTKEFCKLPESSEYCNYFYEFIGKGGLIIDLTKGFSGSGNFKVKGRGKVTKASHYYYKVKNKSKIKISGSAIFYGTDLLLTKTYKGSGSIKINISSISHNNDLGIIEFLAIGNFEITDSSNRTPVSTFKPIANNNIVSSACSCPVLTNVIYFSNNIFKRNSLLDKFIYRNNLESKEIISLYYDNNKQHYFNSIKFDGLSLTEGSKESWNISITFNCTNQLDINNNKLWLFSCSITRKIYDSKKYTNTESKLAIFFPYDSICSKIDAIEFYNRVNLSELIVYNRYKDTRTKINITNFKDNIKLFTSGNWLTDPYFNVFMYSKPIILESYFRPEVSLKQQDIRKAITDKQES